jgi:hypothetical protein
LVERISYESHICGAVAGVLLALAYRHVPPAHVAPPIEFQDDEEEDNGDVGEDDEVDEAGEAMQRRLADEADAADRSDPFGPMWRSTSTHPMRARWLERQRPRQQPPAEDEEVWP